jgi:hypothetical protein
MSGPGGRATVRVIFAPDTSELLEWSEPGEVHVGDQPGEVAPDLRVADRVEHARAE